MPEKTICLFGATVIDEIQTTSGEVKRQPGGTVPIMTAVLNKIISDSSLNVSLRSFARVGADTNGHWLKNFLEKHFHGISIEQREGEKTKVNQIEMDDSGDWHFNSSFPQKVCYLPDLELMPEADYVIFSAVNSLYRIQPQETLGLAEKAKNSQRVFMLSRSGVGLDREFLSCIRPDDWIFCNKAELEGVLQRGIESKDIHLALQELSWNHCVVTLGAEGYVIHWGKTQKYFPITKIKVIHSVGAGDTFASAFILKMIENHDHEASGRFASSKTAEIISQKESWLSILG